MPAKFFHIDPKANRATAKLPKKVQDKIDKAFDLLRQNPLKGEKLHGELAGYYKYRIGDYRIIYWFNARKSIIFIVKIEHRQGVYR